MGYLYNDAEKKYVSADVFSNREEVLSWMNYNLSEIESGRINIISITDCMVGAEREITIYYIENGE